MDDRRRPRGSLEQQILAVLGAAGRPMTPAEVRDALGGELAYTTVMTVLARLHEKGATTRSRAGRAFAYRLAADDAELTARRMRRLLPGFVYVAAFERQKRGAWHVHMAIHRLPTALPYAGVKVKSFNVVRAVWRAVVGDLGGNIDQQRRKRWSQQSSGKLAAYLSKYMLKAFAEGEDWSNRYSGSQGIELPAPVVVRSSGSASSP